MIPKRKKEIAINIGRIVEEQFLSIDEITNNLVTEQDKEYIIASLFFSYYINYIKYLIQYQ